MEIISTDIVPVKKGKSLIFKILMVLFSLMLLFSLVILQLA